MKYISFLHIIDALLSSSSINVSDFVLALAHQDIWASREMFYIGTPSIPHTPIVTTKCYLF